MNHREPTQTAVFQISKVLGVLLSVLSLTLVISSPGSAQCTQAGEAANDDDPYDYDNDGVCDGGPYVAPTTPTYPTYPCDSDKGLVYPLQGCMC
jgi:hypothetical protein